MMGKQSGVAARLLADLPGITINKCICHSLHLVASDACKILPRAPEDLVRNIYNFFNHSSKRQAQLAEFQHFCDMSPHLILKPAQTRWLSLSMVVDRILEQWNPLMTFFMSGALDERLLTADSVLHQMHDPQCKLYLKFLKWILPKFTKLNEFFQGESGRIAVVHTRMSETFVEILSLYMHNIYVKRTGLHLIDPKDVKNFKPLNELYLGIEVAEELSKVADKTAFVTDTKTRCREFLIKACEGMKDRYDFSPTNPLSQIYVLQAAVATQYSPNRPDSLVNLMKVVPRIVSPQDLGAMQKIDDEWRLLPMVQDLPNTSLKLDEFWAELWEKKSVTEEHQFFNVASFALDVLNLPHTSAECERIFHKYKLCKTRLRNKLITDTVNATLLTAQCMRSGGGCDKFMVPERILSLMTAAMYDNSYDLETGLHFCDC